MMAMRKRFGARLLAVLTAAALLPLAAPAKLSAAQGQTDGAAQEADTQDLLSIVYETVSYKDYLAAHSGAAYPDAEIRIEGGTYQSAEAGFTSEQGYEGYDGNVALTGEEGEITWEVTVAEAGFYQIKLDYFPMEGKGNTIERELRINGELPFDGAQSLEFSRIWKNETGVKDDARGNHIRPSQIEERVWREAWCKDSSGYETDAYYFYFEKGKNTISLTSTKEPMAVGAITLKRQPQAVDYSVYYSSLKDRGIKEAVLSEPIKIQGEDAVLKSDSTLYPVNDRTSPLTEPYHPSKIRMNSIGGNNWNQTGQWISWEVTVPEDGLYEIAVKYKQSIKQGVTVVRSLAIDGELPFKEAAELRFYYDNNWDITTLGDGEDSYRFYLTAGKHTLTMEVVLGKEMAQILNEADNSIFELNRAYRQLLMVIGSSPDSMRDYQLELKTPEALSILKEQYEIIKDLSARVKAYAKGSSGSESVALDNLIIQLGNMSKKPETIAKQWSAFKDNIIALGSWTLSMKEQPLQIDYLLVQSADSKLPKAKAGFWQKVMHEWRAFLASFTEDYESIGNVYGSGTVEVWMLADASAAASASGSGRDQANVLKNLVDNYFVEAKGIPVNVKLVNRDILLSATLAGQGPDVALGVASKEPVNYALRKAATDLTQFSDFDEVSDWFFDDAFNMFRLNDGVYALPQTSSFPMLFYRADILKELGLDVPRTWDEFYQCLAVIQKNNMNIGISPDYSSYGMCLYQHGGSYYAPDGKSSGLDTEAAVQAFTQWTSNYVDYRMPVTYDFANRFRTGEMPLAIADYTQYSYLSVFAPEIKGLWGFTVVPGYEDENGNIDHSVLAGQSAVIILDTSKRKQESWEFLKWWMSEETQTSYGVEVENILGVAGRVATANVMALENLPWTSRDLKQLKAQMDWVKVVPEIPGGYFTERHVKNAFYAVYNSNEDPRETLEDYVKTINNEITNKRIEFGLEAK